MSEYESIIKGNYDTQGLPSECLILKGQAIEDIIEGYRTLSVSGRELVPKKVRGVSSEGMNGQLFLGSNYEPRPITIKYQLTTKNNEDFRKSYEKLNFILSENEMEIKFLDDLEHSFFGTLSDVGGVPEGTNSVVSTFTLLCSDPFKYQTASVASGSSAKIIFEDSFNNLPNRIIVTPKQNLSTITLETNGNRIRLSNGDFKVNNKIIFDFFEEHIYSGENPEIDFMRNLDLSSKWEDFYLKSGVPVTVIENADLEVYFRRAIL